MLLGGGATGVATMSLNGELEDECADGKCLPDSHEKLDKRDALALTSDILIWGGVAVAGAGAALLIIDLLSDENPSSVALLPAVGAGHAGLTFTRSF